jgi:hypothetical protein
LIIAQLGHVCGDEGCLFVDGEGDLEVAALRYGIADIGLFQEVHEGLG